MDKVFILVFTVECIFLACLFVLADYRWTRDRSDAEKWRHGQKPIGRLINVESDEQGLRVTGTITDPALARAIQGPVTNYSIDVPPKPEWEVKKTHFIIHQDRLLDMPMKDWELFTRAVQQTWVEMLKNDGYQVGDTVTSYVEEAGGLVYGYQKVGLEVKVYKEET